MVLYNLVKGLDKRQFELIVVSIIPVAEIGKKIQDLGVKILSLEARFKYDPLIFLIILKIDLKMGGKPVLICDSLIGIQLWKHLRIRR